MAIVYNVPRISLSAGDGQFEQKGPTCWYYSVKMLRKFHQIGHDQMGNWRALHALRTILTELGGDTYLGDEAFEDLHWVRGRLTATVKQYEDGLRRYTAGKGLPHGHGRDHELKVGETAAKMALGVGSAAEAERKLGEYRAALAALDGLADTTRMDILNRFTTGLEEVFEDANQLTSARLETLLLTWGPFYASGEVWSKGEDRKERTGGGGGDVKVEVRRLDSGCHAVVVAGVNGDTLFYKDPNNSAQLRMIDFAKFRTGWANAGQCRMIRITCPQANGTGANAGCNHLVPGRAIYQPRR